MPTPSLRCPRWQSVFRRESKFSTGSPPCGAERSSSKRHAVLYSISIPIPRSGTYGNHGKCGPIRLATGKFVFRCCSLSLCDCGRNSVLPVRCFLLLVSQGNRANVQRDPGETPFLVVFYRFS